MFTLRGHDAQVYRIAFSPDGLLLASGASDNTYRLWNLVSLSELGRQRHEIDFSSGIVFSREGTRLFTTCVTEPFARVWTVPSFELIERLKHSHGYLEGPGISWQMIPGWIGPLALSPDGRLLASMNSIGVVVWEVSTLKELPVNIPIRTSRGEQIAFTSDSQRLLFNDSKGTIYGWDLASQSLVCIFDHHVRAAGWNRSTCAWALSPDGNTLVSSGTDKRIRVFDFVSGKERHRIESHSGFVTAVAFSPDGKYLAYAGVDQTVRLCETSTRRLVATFRGHEREVLALAFSPAGNLLASAGRDQTIKLWRVGEKAPLSPVLGLSPQTWSVQMAAHGQTVLLLKADGAFTLASTASWEQIATNSLPVSPRDIARMDLSPDGSLLALGMKSETVRLLDLRTMRERPPLLAHDQHNHGFEWLHFSGDGKRLLAYEEMHGKLRLWEVANSQQIGESGVANNGNVTCVRLSTHGDKLAIGYKDGGVELRDVVGDRTLIELHVHKAAVLDALLLPDQNRIITASADGTVKVSDLRSKQTLATFGGALRSMNCLAVTSDSRLLAAGTEDGAIKLWELNSEQEVATLKGHRSEIRRLAFTTNGNTLVSVGGDAVIAWRAPAAETIELAEQAKRADRGRRPQARPPHPDPGPFDGSGATRQSWVSRLKQSAQDGLAKARLAVLLLDRISDDPALLEEADLLSAEAVDLLPEQEEVWLTRAKVQERRSDIPAAIATLRQAAARPTATPQLWQSLGQTCENAGDFDQAIRSYSRAIDLAEANPRDFSKVCADSLTLRARTLEKLGRHAEAMADHLAARGIPPRPEGLKPNLIDLSPYYNAHFNGNWHGDTANDNDLASLPTGVQALVGVQFDVRALVQVGSSHAQGGSLFPTNVNGIRLATTCRRLHFLHGALWGADPPGTQIGSYVLHYASGESRERPIVLGNDVIDWWKLSDTETNAAGLTVAWQGANAKSRREGKTIRLYKSVWEHPLPHVEIQALDFVSSMAEGAPFLIAITVEP